MNAASPKPLAPSPEEIDFAAKEYVGLRAKYLEAKKFSVELENQAELKGEILRDLVAQFGGAHAEKSKILHGAELEIMCTYSQYSSVDAAAVENFRDALRKSKQARLLSKIFEKTIRWTLKSEASEIMRGSKLTTKLQALWGKCILLKDRNPSLVVREKQRA